MDSYAVGSVVSGEGVGLSVVCSGVSGDGVGLGVDSGVGSGFG